MSLAGPFLGPGLGTNEEHTCIKGALAFPEGSSSLGEHQRPDLETVVLTPHSSQFPLCTAAGTASLPSHASAGHCHSHIH